MGRTLRREKFRRNVVILLDREGGGEFGGDRGEMSTERVGLNEISDNCGDHSIPSLLTLASRTGFSLEFVAAVDVVGLVRFISKENF